MVPVINTRASTPTLPHGKRLLLVGGGHSHVEVLRRLALLPASPGEVTLVSPEAAAPYSGMLPGLVAGHYREDETHIPLAPLARAAGARLRRGRVIALDLYARVATLASGEPLPFEVVSLDVGSTPDASVPGAREHAVRVKPVPDFLDTWVRMQADAAAGNLATIAVVGGGAGGVELLLAMQHRLREQLGPDAPRFALVTDQPHLLPQHAEGVRRRIGRVLVGRHVVLHFRSAALAVEPGAVLVEGRRRISADAIVWATAASAAPWLHASGLQVDGRGFVCVDAHLRSLSHRFVFAAGDCATLAHAPHPKSGLYAVRHGPPLAANLVASLMGGPLVEYRPQRRGLSLISTGGREAILSWDGIAAQGRWAWQWKDRIDRRFMSRYGVAPAKPAALLPPA